MSFKRVAHLDIKQVYATDENGKFQWRSFVKQANDNPSQDRTDFLPKDAYKYDTNHFLFLTARAISGGEKWGHNGNYDYFPWEEIKKALPTYPGCGFYIEHKEDSEEDAKGIVLDAFANDEEEYAVCLCAIDKDEYPEFCQQILDGTYNQVSMSCLANECECSECGNVAHSFDELCQHMNPNMPITFMKGKQNDKGEDIYEINRDLCFSGLSAVAVPADKDAFVFDIKAAKKKENKLQTELVKYQNIKQAAKMKEFKIACEEQFKALDTVALLNKLQNCATAITNQVVDQQNDVNIINGPLQGILRQLMELQIGLTVLDLNKLTEKKEDFIDNAVAVEGEPNTDVAEVTTNVEEKDGEGHLLTEDDLDVVNFDKEIESYDNWSYTPFSSTAKEVKSGTWAFPNNPSQALKLKELLSNPIYNTDSDDINRLYDLLGDDELFDSIDSLNDKTDIRPIVIDRLTQFLPDMKDNKTKAILEEIIGYKIPYTHYEEDKESRNIKRRLDRKVKKYHNDYWDNLIDKVYK